MFGWLQRDPVKRLEKAYQAKMTEAYEAEKFGDRVRQAGLYAEAEALRVELEALRARDQWVTSLTTPADRAEDGLRSSPCWC